MTTHITITPDLSGWRYITEIEENGKTIRRGHENFRELLAYCRLHGLPVVVDGGSDRWVRMVTARLTHEQVTVRTPGEQFELERGE